MNRGLAVALGFIGLFVVLALLGVIFGKGMVSPLPKVDEQRYHLPERAMLVAPADKVRETLDPTTGFPRLVVAEGFAVYNEVPQKTEIVDREDDFCEPSAAAQKTMVRREVRRETHGGIVVGRQVDQQREGDAVVIRAPEGGTLIEKTLSFRGFWTWVAAFLTICILSFLYDDNPLYKFAEHLFIGVSAAYWMVLGFWTVLVPNLLGKLWPSLAARVNPGLTGAEQDLFYLVPALFGVLLLMRLSSRFGWLSRWALAFIVGATAGLNFMAYLRSDFLEQIGGAIRPLIVFDAEHHLLFGPTFSAVVMVIGVLAGLVYFFFSSEHKGLMGAAGRVGVWVLMVTFGASFGYTVMGRLSLLVGRMEFIFAEWLKIIVR